MKKATETTAPTFAERLAADLHNGRAVESYPYGAPARRDAWAHVADRGHVATLAPLEFNTNKGRNV